MEEKIKVYQYSTKYEFIKSYDSINDASRITGINCASICLCINNKQKTSNGYIFRKELRKDNKKTITIQAKDLRIGNLVDFYGIETIVDINLLQSFLSKKIELQPIPLTEELLLELGFQCYVFDNGKPNQFRFKSRLIVIRDNCFVEYGTNVKILYVHSLQNLIFALLGKELELKPTEN